MFFCPFCGTLLLLQPRLPTNSLCCSTCEYVHPITEEHGVLTVTHSFLQHNKAVVDEDFDDDMAKAAAAEAAATNTSGSATEAGAGVTASSSSSSSEAMPSAEGGQVTTVACQNEEVTCDSRKAYYVQLQMRSADEPPTTFYKCVKCGYQWRQD